MAAAVRTIAFGLLGCVVGCSSVSTGAEDAASAETAGGKHVAPAVEARAACPAPFDTNRPVAGENTGFVAGGQSRRFQLLLPPSSFTGPRPLVFAFHGTTENGARFIARAKLTELTQRGFIVVAPDANNNGSFWPVWDAMRASGTEGQPNPDIELFDRLVSCTSAHYSVDKDRIFAVGHSAGGIFTNRLLRTRSSVLAGGIAASGLFDFTGDGGATPEEPLLAIVTWGGDNDTYRGTTPTGVHVPAFSFVEQASLASKHYASQRGSHVRCRGDNLGHAWLPLNSWFADLMMAHPKNGPRLTTLPPPPAGSPVSCSTEPYDLAPLPNVVCGAGARVGCHETCQLFADCAVENRTVGPSLATELQSVGFTSSSCGSCVQRCDAAATTSSDALALSCFRDRGEAAQCRPGIEGASPLFQAVNACCKDRADSRLCVDLCTTLNANSAARAFFPTCQQIAH